MATLRGYILALGSIGLVSGLGFSVAGGSEHPLPRNVFEKDAVVKYMMWWRPYKVIFDKRKVLAIQEKIDSIDMEKAASIEAEFFSKEEQSAFLFPVLATYGEKGTVILERFLKMYSARASLDDRWLLIVACLGRIPTPQAQKILEDEYERVLREYDFSHLYRRPSREDIYDTANGGRLPKNDGRRAIMDALLACLAGQQKLSASEIELFGGKYDKGPFFAWGQGLEWVYQLMPKEKVLETIERLLMSCEEQELVNARNSILTERIRALVGFIIDSDRRDMWALMRNLALKQGERRRTVSEFLLVYYAAILSGYAETGRGVYPLDEEVVNAFMRSGIENSRTLSIYCKILLSLKPTSEYAGWEEFLRGHAEHILKEDEGPVEDLVRGIRNGRPDFVNAAEKRKSIHESIRRPGVYMLGFRAR